MGIKNMRHFGAVLCFCIGFSLMLPVAVLAQEEGGAGYTGVDPATEKSRTEGFDSNFVKCLQQNECGACEKSPGLTNQFNFLGFYQMGVPYASEAICTNGISGSNNWARFKEKCVLSAWAKSIGITSHNDWMYGGGGPPPAEYTPAQIERARYLQTQMLLKKSEMQWKNIQKKLGSCIGKNMNGVVMTKETMVAMAHLKGMGGLIQTCNGDKGVRDGNGTSTLSYASCLAGCMNNEGKKGKCSFTVPHICDKKKSSGSSSTSTETGTGTSGSSSDTGGTGTGSGTPSGDDLIDIGDEEVIEKGFGL